MKRTKGTGGDPGLERDIDAIVSGRDPGGGIPRVVVDHRGIDREDLRIARSNARLDPSGQVFPWRPTYPLAGATVYHDGRLWIVYDKEYGRPAVESLATPVRLVGSGSNHDEVTAPRDRIRPVLWTQDDEDRLHRS